MKVLYAPYRGSEPAPLEVKGHHILIVSPNEELLSENRSLLGAEKIEPIVVGSDKVDMYLAFSSLAEKIKGGIVMAPEDVDMEELISSLERELPWIH